MATNSPGRGATPWSARLSPQDLPLQAFLRNGLTDIPVAFVPTNGGAIRHNNPGKMQGALRAATDHFNKISSVRPFGKGGVVIRSSDVECLQDLLKCESFATFPVSPFVPAHLACTKGIIRGVDTDMSVNDMLEEFAPAGVIAVHRCSRIENDSRYPTESVIATFAGVSLPSEIKVWPLIFRVEALSPRPLQCKKCWRFGHSVGGCKSAARCCSCGGDHPPAPCNTEEVTCCLCSNSHPADYSGCPVREQEMKVLEVIEKRRCTRSEAMTVVRERSTGYASVAARGSTIADSSIAEIIAIAIEKSQAKIMDRYMHAMTELLAAHTAHVSQTVSALCGVAVQTDSTGESSSNPVGSLNQLPLGESDVSESPNHAISTALQSTVLPENSQHSSSTPNLHASLQSCSGNDPSSSKLVQRKPCVRQSTKNRPASKPSASSETSSEDMEYQTVPFKRTGSPTSGSQESSPKYKTKKGQGVHKTDDILEAAVAAINSP